MSDQQGKAKVLRFLCPNNDPDCLVEAEKTLAGVFSVGREAGISEETCLAFIGKEFEARQKEAGAAQVRHIVKELRRQAGWGGKHPLSGMAGGPDEAGGGPPDLKAAVTQKEVGDTLSKLLAGIADNQPVVRLSESVQVARAAGDLCFYVKVKAKEAPDGFTQQFPVGTWTAECVTLQAAAALAARALRP